jgi:hypothetical protein
MNGVRLGGIDPSILRELSGVYKPFVKAFKELVSNAFDADADTVHVELANDCSWLTVEDDGVGMTPFEFRNDFTRIGGGSRRWLGERTRKGRLRIGSKGIGFLALARYCSSLEIESSGNRVFTAKATIAPGTTAVSLSEVVGFPIPDLLLKKMKCSIRQKRGRIGKLSRGTHYVLSADRGTVRIVRDIAGSIELTLHFDCHDVAFFAVLDFERLLELADKADLDKLDQFATIDIRSVHESTRHTGTKITARSLRPFVRRELLAGRRKGNVRNIASRDGVEQFKWHLARCTPIEYALEGTKPPSKLRDLLRLTKKSHLRELKFSHGSSAAVLRRFVYPYESDSQPLHDDMLVEVRINESGLRATGFLAGYESVIFPAEYRGITIRVRGVAIGDPSFLGAEYLLTGANKAALSQITGEINILSGLNAVDALNPGRESFYEECAQYKVLRHKLVGDGEHVAGCLGQVIAAVLRRSQVRSALKDVIGRAMIRRRVLDDISSAVGELIATGDAPGRAVRALLQRKSSHTNGLAAAPDLAMTAPPRVGGLKVVPAKNLPESADIDYGQGEIRLDTTRPEWDWRFTLFNRRLHVANKRGRVDQPLGELDLRNDRLLLNWEHPIRSQMDERGFLRTAVSWILAREAAAGDADSLIELALRLMSYRSSTSDA